MHIEKTEDIRKDLPRPDDDGAAAHLPGRPLPAIELPSTGGGQVAALSELVARTVVFVYPNMGGIDDALLEEWTAIPGARGCTPEACGFRDQRDAFQSGEVDVLGLSGQPLEQQRNAVERLGLPPHHAAAQALEWLAQNPVSPK